MKNLYKNKVINIFIIGCLLVLLLSTLFVNSRFQDWNKYDRDLQLLRDIKLLNALVNQNLLSIRYQLFTSFDELSTNLTKLKQKTTELEQKIELAAENTSHRQKLDTLKQQLQRKLLLAEDFKSQNAILKNSLVVLPRLVQQLQSKLKQFKNTEAISAQGDNLIKEIYLYSHVNDNNLDQKMMQRVDNIKTWQIQEISDLFSSIQIIYKHASTVVDFRRDVNTITTNLLQIPIDAFASNVQDSYSQKHQSLIDRSNVYRTLLYLLSIVLLAYTAYVLVRLKQNTVELTHEKNRALVTLHSIGDGIITTNALGLIQYINPVAEQITGWNTQAAHNKPLEKIFRVFDERTSIAVKGQVERCIRENKKLRSANQSILINNRGESTAIEDTVAPIRDNNGNTIGAIIVFRDVSRTRELSRKLSYQASHDSLTDVINRRTFELKLAEAINHSKQNRQTHALLYLDLDQFKIVNDTCGHDAGDQLLIQVTSLLQDMLSKQDILARLGGDEFGILLHNQNLERAREYADDILCAIKQFRFEWQSIHFQLGVSIGVTAIDHNSSSFVSALSAADMACYVAKDTGRNRVHIYTHGNKELIRRKGEMQWVSRLTKCFKENRFVLYKQPIVALNTCTRQEQRYELLLRIRDENDDIIQPEEFIPAAERYNFMPTLDRWVIHTTFSNAHLFMDNEYFSINLSGTSLNSNTLLTYIIQEAKSNRILPERICFEITETAAVNNLSKAAKLIKELKTLGFKFALDDFGKGLSSFTYLSKLPVDYLKIDGEFVRNLTENSVNHAIIWSINNIGQMLGMKIIAEYVEDEQTHQVLSDIGVDFAQGYKFGQPTPINQNWLYSDSEDGGTHHKPRLGAPRTGARQNAPGPQPA